LDVRYVAINSFRSVNKLSQLGTRVFYYVGETALPSP